MGISVFQCTLHMKCVFILSGAQLRVFPFSLVLIHHVQPYCSSQVIDEVQCTTCMILRTQPSYTGPVYQLCVYRRFLSTFGLFQGYLGRSIVRCSCCLWLV